VHQWTQYFGRSLIFVSLAYSLHFSFVQKSQLDLHLSDVEHDVSVTMREFATDGYGFQARRVMDGGQSLSPPVAEYFTSLCLFNSHTKLFRGRVSSDICTIFARKKIRKFCLNHVFFRPIIDCHLTTALFQLDRNEAIVRAQLALVQRKHTTLSAAAASAASSPPTSAPESKLALAARPSSPTASSLFALSNIASSLSKLAYFWRHFQRTLLVLFTCTETFAQTPRLMFFSLHRHQHIWIPKKIPDAKRLAETEFAWTTGAGLPPAASRQQQSQHQQPPHPHSLVTTPFPGVNGLLRHSTSALLPSPSSSSSLSSLHSSRRRMIASFGVYASDARARALRLCGWWPLVALTDTATAATTTGNHSTATAISHSNASNIEAQLEAQLLALESAGEHARAAALALFYLDLDRAVLALQRASDLHYASSAASASSAGSVGSGAQQNQSSSSAPPADLSSYPLVAVAISGFPDQDSGNGNGNTSESKRRWLRTCESVRPLISHPYLRAAFAFLCADVESPMQQQQQQQQPGGGGSGSGDGTLGSNADSGATDQLNRYADVLNAGMDLVDRVAFALRFLPDAELFALLARWAGAAIAQGDLGGCILTGLSTAAGFELMQVLFGQYANGGG
jgi:hypothetical protein